ncbi:unnamed protein product [marine sediment metagenome]|uniref:Uncharacterized protein n=1 Tax=marine sediment metagenome TaxID=412755 RepID=X1A3Z0_9ZZZZ
MENKEDKNVRISWKTWALLQAKTTELKIKTGKNITIKGYIDNLILKDLEKKEKI